MLREWAEASFHWQYSLEDILGLVLVAAVIGLYSLMLAITRRPARGWLIAACVSIAIMAALISASPSQSRRAAAEMAGVGGMTPDNNRREILRPPFARPEGHENE